MSFTKIVHNVSTGKITEVNLSQQELDIVKANEEHGKKIAQEELSKAAARQNLIDKLGLTEEEARLLLGGN